MRTPPIPASKVLLDGFTAHVACLGDITGREFQRLNPISQASFSSLAQSLILHEKILVGREVIGPSARLRVLFQIFGSALEESPSIPQENPLIVDYHQLKAQYSATDGIDDSYENGLTNLVQRHFFEGKQLRGIEPQLMNLLQRHSALRAKMYVQLAFQQGVPYVPSPYRRLLFNDPVFRESTKWTKLHQPKTTELSDLTRRFNPSIEDASLNEAVPQLNELVLVPFEIPAVMKVIVRDAGDSGILTTAHQVRNSDEARDFRALLGELQLADSARTRARLELEALARTWQATRSFKGARVFGALDGFGRVVSRRPAYILLHNILDPSARWPSLTSSSAGPSKFATLIANWTTRIAKLRTTNPR